MHAGGGGEGCQYNHDAQGGSRSRSVDEDVPTKKDKKLALGGKGKKGNIDLVLKYAISCCEANCRVCYQFDDETLKKANLMVDNVKWDGPITFVDLQWYPVPAEFKRIKAFTKMKKHLVEVHGLSSDDLPPLFKKGTQRMEETKKKRLSMLLPLEQGGSRDG
jgi:hypothetical protein